MKPEHAEAVAEAIARYAELGARTLDDVALLTVLLEDPEAARALVGAFNVRRLGNVSEDELLSVPGITPDRARLLAAAGEIGRRLWPDDDPPLIRGPEEIYTQCADIRGANREHFLGFYLNSRHQLLRREVVSIGTLSASIVHPREVFAPAIRLSAASLVLAHNHPSGDTTPSEEDLAITRRLHEVGRLLGIELIDHVIVTRDGYASFRERRLIRG